ncbi:ectoine/hydroxyectoine ABC transporter substrate-binding protein EhuB [Pseudovibrio exalbescens]|uniref:Ectoine/hydroxyectoine ABC transporter substrate-binding protein EhuB n=1 Tax=Pseudovibrio exalbescens TaxID=197461 RepID=A0A1U7JLN0_9HYPH|nr:ectoine/hydroxyectoine ABC transporter substrate-binding protein EhuB [Pseudovibrio exalbescens]OKL45656.1 ectoine/hydroxyectoine ABC transporter substrate-binding protein EhuB [Pseudovibrio exalbescens]
MFGNFKRNLLGVSLAVAGIAAAGLNPMGVTSAQAQDTLERLKEQGYARIAIANEPPYTEVTAGGEVTGAAPEVARAVLKRLGVNEVVASVSEYGAMIPGLQAGRFDLVAAGLFIKPERCAAVIFSEPDLCDAEAFAVKKGNPLGLTTYEEVAAHESARIGAPGGGTEERLALEAGVPRDRVVVVPDGQSGIKMLQDGRLDVYALPTLSIGDLLKKADDPNLEMVTPIEGTPVYCAGAAFRKQDTALRNAYDEALAEMKESGEFQELVASFGFPGDAPNLTSREELCGGPN